MLKGIKILSPCMIGTYGLWEGKGSLSCHTSMTGYLGFYYLIRRTAPFSHILLQAEEIPKSIPTRVTIEKTGKRHGFMLFHTYRYRIPLKLREEIQNSSQIEGRNSEFLSNWGKKFLNLQLKLKTIHKCFLCTYKRQRSMLCFIAFKFSRTPVRSPYR